MDYNFHTHTPFCSHATGSPEEYVLKAIEGGIRYMGFSDHAPFRFPDGYESYYRVPLDKVNEYKDTVFALREKYKDKIKIYFGFEMEYYPDFFDEMLKIVKNAGAEYLILGQHFLYNEHPHGMQAFCTIDSEKDFDHYAECIINAIKSGVFTYVAHPDTLGLEDLKKYKEKVEKICIASKKYDVPLEINFQGIREKRAYPREAFWEVAGKIGCPVTFGFDAHQTHAACDLKSLPKSMALVEKFKLNYIGKPKLKSL